MIFLGCNDLVQKEPKEFEATEKILLCHPEQESGDGSCEEISYALAQTMCSMEPAIVTNSIKKKMRKRRHTRNVCCGLVWGK